MLTARCNAPYCSMLASRYNEDGSEKPEFVLNKDEYRAAKFLICGDNFGCGSSREHAPWALKDWGLMCVISTSFADIFRSNCYKNGMLPIVLPYEIVRTLMSDAEKLEELSVDLEKQEVYRANGEAIAFEIDPFLKHCLVNGLDQIGLTLQKKEVIATFEATRSKKYPWLDGMGYRGGSKAGAAAAAGGGDAADSGAETTTPTPPASRMIYSDDASLGQAAPPIDSLEYISGEPITLGNGTPTCIMFWSKNFKGDYTTIVGTSKIADAFGAGCQFVGVSLDADKKDSESFLKKIGTAMPEIYIDKLEANFPLAWDAGKTLKKSYQEVASLPTLLASAVFVVDGAGKIVWREQFAQGYAPKHGQLEEQIRRVVAGQVLIDNGARPVVEDEEEEEMDMGGGDDDFDW